MFTRVLLLFVLTLVPHAAFAQGWDITGTIGLFSGLTPRDENSTGYQESWFQAVQGGVIVGRHLSPQLKLEFDTSVSSDGKQYRERSIAVPGYPYPYFVSSEVNTSVRSIGAALTYQFGRNEWVHPFVQAGISGDFDRVTVRTWEQLLANPRPGGIPERVIEERLEGPTITSVLRGVVGGGAKLYVTEKAFFRTDGRWSFGHSQHHLAARIGFGVDF